MSSLLVGLIENSFKTTGCIFFLVVSYKLYRSKYIIDSDCFKHALKFHSQNSGNEEIKLDNILSVNV